MSTTVSVMPRVVPRTRAALVDVFLDGVQRGQLTAAAARAFALDLIDCAARAEAEAALVGYLTEARDLSDAEAGEALRHYRAQRRD